ncbi:MAG: hypothetical protein A2X67_07055 [Ignavibacteria bacterium GWA2_55_11]|nr:MAG: hypothetical protein A2X67_07055 [Ignavibacteria bacterium GWA2_55_11]OGU45006.1 MAG: hypothetical protein A2X68_03405 [Ignavibacteria bacterium GWC2_56_12]OGU74967.1 MAG: hypothetical protein A3H45_01950 [Ignavibacteria bacterium RIFCSPLOWO2_02_FULL_55_14]OGU76024.1 MAG: hypothetical protein A3G43_13755 [Ignavibacteria bacterium RIFCSPLOWO2_12_FULL_56_21]HAV21951.1 molybdopterin synthase sulfur carrier subunit [Bacteroidota bacterium]
MMVTVRLPGSLRSFAGNKSECSMDGATVDEVLQNLTKQYAGLRFQLYAESGELRRFVNIFVNKDDIRGLHAGHTNVRTGDVISIIPSIAGG